jgi:hypothetical protein
MALPYTTTQFFLDFPEFVGASAVTLQKRIDWATDRTDAAIWDVKTEQGIAWMTAHFMALLPEAKDMRMGEKPGESMYGRERSRLNKIVSSGFRAVLDT